MHIPTHVRNFRHSLRVCTNWPDRFFRALWPYRHKAFFKNLGEGTRQFSFLYPDPIGDIRVIIRDNNCSDACVFGEVFDRLYYDFPVSARPGTILDLGANVGFATLFFARKYPAAEIACVEPMPGNVSLLRKNLELNRVGAAVSCAAIAVEDGSIQMEIAAQDYGHRVAGIPFGHAATGRTLTVKAVSVPSLLRELGWERIGLLKVDIEGYEGILLKQKCDWLRRVDVLCLECHDGYGEADLRTLAAEYGFAPPREFRGIWLLVRRGPGRGGDAVAPS